MKSEIYAAPYNSYSFELELWGLKQALRQKPKWIFFPYADYDYYYWQYFRRLLGAKVILWSFFSEKELQERFADLSHFERADIVLVAGQGQCAWFEQNAPRVNVAYFPIGVDTEFFSPGAQFYPNRIVHVGSNRRDFDTLIAAMDLIYERVPDLDLVLVGANTRIKEIPARPYLTNCGQLGDEEYRAILQSSNFGVLSLEDGGSSNSLLELLACGLPVVVTKLPNLSDYASDESCLFYEKSNVPELAAHCLDLISNLAKRQKMTIEAVSQAKKYDWRILREGFYDLFFK